MKLTGPINHVQCIKIEFNYSTLELFRVAGFKLARYKKKDHFKIQKIEIKLRFNLVFGNNLYWWQNAIRILKGLFLLNFFYINKCLLLYKSAYATLGVLTSDWFIINQWVSEIPHNSNTVPGGSISFFFFFYIYFIKIKTTFGILS